MVKIAVVMPKAVHIVPTVHYEFILDAPFETAAFCREMVDDKMRGAFIEMFGDEIAGGGVEARICSNWGGEVKTSNGSASL